MKKQILLLAMMLLPMVAGAQGVVEIDGIYYELVSQIKEATVTYNPSGYGKYSGNVVIPDSVTYEGVEYSVTSIGYQAFLYCSRLTSITIPNSVRSIGNAAFYNCSGLISITIPNSVTSVGHNAFYNCSGLTSITIPNSVVSIGNYAFYNCSGLTSITIPNSMVSIGNFAFNGCSSLQYNEYNNAYYLGNEENPYIVLIKSKTTDITICDIYVKCKFIYSYAFSGCSDLTSVTIPNSVMSIGSFAFNGCSSLQYNEYNNAYYLGNDENPYTVLIKSRTTDITICDIYVKCKFIYSYAFSGCSGLASVTIPNSVTSIGDDAFRGCSGLASVTIPNSVTSIGLGAFYGCSGLTSLTIGNGLTSIGSEAFYGCSSLTSVHISDIAAWCTMSFSDFDTNPLYYARHLYLGEEEITDLVIPNSVKSIGENTFQYCSGLTSVTIGNSVTNIGRRAFEGCSGLLSLTLGNGVTSIGYFAFSGCSGLTSVTIPNSVTSIGDQAFSDCSGLTFVTIGNSVTSIGYGAFRDCSGLTSVTIPNSVTSIGDRAFEGCSSLIVKVPVTDYSAFCNNKIIGLIYNNIGKAVQLIDTEGEEITEYIVPDGVTSIESNAFKNCTGLTSVMIPGSVTSIGDDVFSQCSGLTSVTIPNSVTSIGGAAFEGCSSLIIKVPVTDYSAFCNNKIIGLISSNIGKPVQLIDTEGEEITKYVVPDGVISIETNAFRNCTGLTSITIADSVTSIGDDAFLGCSGLISVTIPNSVTSIGESAFTFCSGLTSVTIGNSVTSIEREVFNGCSSLTSVTIPNSVTSIGYRAFSYCSGLTSVTIPNSVTSIGYGAFSYCSGLTSVTIPNSVTSIGIYAFSDCSSLTSVTIGNSVMSIERYAFSGCNSLMTVKSYIEKPFNIDKFSEGTYRQGTLYVPKGTKDLYIRFDGWREFLDIQEMEYEPAPNGQCATPTIIISGKKIIFECTTPDAEFTSSLTTEEIFTGNELTMESRDLVYTLTVYATAPGYDRSEPTSVKFKVDRCDVNNDGTVNIADIATIISKMAE